MIFEKVSQGISFVIYTFSDAILIGFVELDRAETACGVSKYTCSSHRSISFCESMPPPSDSATN